MAAVNTTHVLSSLTSAGIPYQSAVFYLCKSSPSLFPAILSTLLVLGADDPSLPIAAADFLVQRVQQKTSSSSSSSIPKRIVFSGGLGRSTPRLYAKLKDYGIRIVKGEEESIIEVELPFSASLQQSENFGKKQLFLDGEIDLSWSASQVARYATEADIYLELFLQHVRKFLSPEQLSFRFPQNGEGKEGEGGEGKGEGVVVIDIFLENGSTHTGTNIAYTAELLVKATAAPGGEGGEVIRESDLPTVAAEMLIFNQPSLMRRSVATAAKRFGAWPVGWSIQPKWEEIDDNEKLRLVSLAYGEFTRFPKYVDSGFILWPEDFPHEILAAFEGMSESLKKQLVEATSLGLDTAALKQEIVSHASSSSH